MKSILSMPNLPVAWVMWQAEPSLTTDVECWITADGAHHTVLSYDVTVEQMHRVCPHRQGHHGGEPGA